MMRRLTIAVLISATWLSGCADNGQRCSGDFCVQLLSSAYQTKPCPADSTQNCTFAAAFFSATDKAQAITDATQLSAKMTVNGREAGVESSAEVYGGDSSLVVQLVLDRSFSITESGSTDTVRSAVLDFIDALPAEATVAVTAFASEPNVPAYLGTDCKNEHYFLDKASAKKIVTDCYQPYPTQTSQSQTKLYDALGSLLPGPNSSPNVIVLFTDGSDTASTAFPSADDARAKIESHSPVARVYAIGLGAEPDEKALTTLSANHFFRASDQASLNSAFAAVSSELKAIFTARVLVAGQESDSKGTLRLTHAGKTVDTDFDLSHF